MADPASAQTTSPPGATHSPTEPPLVTRDPSTVSFPRHYWAPESRATLLALEFLKNDWETLLKLNPPPSGKAVLEEIRHLHSLIGLRAERAEEIKIQNEQTFIPYFFPILMMQPSSHPRTNELMVFAYSLGFITMPFKHRFNRARPSQLSPGLQPIVTVPGHPAYPSGHGFQSWLIALTMRELRPDAWPALSATAQRIGANREVAGVHYPSDTVAGQRLAEQAFAIAKTGKLFRELLAEANAEWR